MALYNNLMVKMIPIFPCISLPFYPQKWCQNIGVRLIHESFLYINVLETEFITIPPTYTWSRLIYILLFLWSGWRTGARSLTTCVTWVGTTQMMSRTPSTSQRRTVTTPPRTRAMHATPPAPRTRRRSSSSNVSPELCFICFITQQSIAKSNLYLHKA